MRMQGELDFKVICAVNNWTLSHNIPGRFIKELLFCGTPKFETINFGAGILNSSFV